jgi:hypothetical protein
MREEHRTPKGQKQNDADKSVGRKKGRIQPAQIIGPYQCVLVNQ